jgi:DNA polymerase I-like protein with 3'-5' exonuclease and polymerase domains
VCVENAVTPEKKFFRAKEEFNEWQTKDKVFVGHNSVAFDIPVLNKFWNARIGISRVVDTFVLSMLYSPSLAGGHSLEAWGQRLKFPKTEHKDFTEYSEEMRKYCENDTAVTKRLYNRLAKRMLHIGFTERGAMLETVAWHIIQNKQRRHGFPFDAERGHKLYVELRAREEELKNEIYKQWPPKFECVQRFAKAFKKDGTPTEHYRRHLEQYPKLEVCEDGGYLAYDWVEFNLGSPPQRIAKLLEVGWKPLSFTKKTEKGGGGNPKVDEESLVKFAEESGNEAGKLLAKWIVINSRANMFFNIDKKGKEHGWLVEYNANTGCIHGNLWLAKTLRYRHDHPNTANIPAVRVKENKETKEKHILFGEEGSYSYECRDLWTCGDTDKYSLVGVDAKGIQLRILANYLNDEEFTKAILSEDPHTANQQRLGLSSRALTKTIVYATLMGAGDSRIASEANVPIKEARLAKQKFFEQVPGLPKLIKRLQNELHRTGRITLCDGSRVLVSSDHMVIPYLLQGDESRIMKQAGIYLDEEIRRNKLDAHKVGDIHDEWQFVVRLEDVEKFVRLALAVFPKTGTSFEYRVPIEGDAKVGKTWAQTH